MPDTNLKKGLELNGFKVRDVTTLPDLNAVLYQLRHLATGARLVHLATADDNNLFAVGFRTPPADSTGVAHILEHTVLCGSRHFPVRDPFFSMLKRSLNTFMNALTSSDWTLYPFASQNEKDFYNLMESLPRCGVLSPAAGAGLSPGGAPARSSPTRTIPTSPLEFKGVVYNEMKGAMADPSSLLGRRLTQALFPTTAYGKNSGGEPAKSPTSPGRGSRLPRRLLPPGQRLLLHLRQPPPGEAPGDDRGKASCTVRSPARRTAPSAMRSASPSRSG